jgi:hypothetical protein
MIDFLIASCKHCPFRTLYGECLLDIKLKVMDVPPKECPLRSHPRVIKLIELPRGFNG